MRYVFILLTIVVLASCGNHKMRFAKTRMTDQKVVEIAEDGSLKMDVESAPQSTVTSFTETPERTSTSSFAIEESIEEDNSDVRSFESELEPLSLAPEDSLKVSQEENDLIIEEAKMAEKNGKRSFMFSVLSPLMFLAGGIVFIISLLGGISGAGAVVGLILMLASIAGLVFSYIFGVKSLNAQFNTKKGRNHAIAGIVISSIFAGLLFINILVGLL